MTGARVVRYTNVATGYPVYRFDTYAPASAKLVNAGYSSSYDAPNIQRPEPRLLYGVYVMNFGDLDLDNDDINPLYP